MVRTVSERDNSAAKSMKIEQGERSQLDTSARELQGQIFEGVKMIPQEQTSKTHRETDCGRCSAAGHVDDAARRIQQRFVRGICDAAAPQVMEDRKLIPQAPMQKLARVTDFKGNRWVDSVYHMSVFSECIVEQAVDVSVAHTRQPCVAVAKVLPQERLQQRTVERIVDVPVPQIWEETVSQVKENFIRHERVRNRTTEQIVASLSSRTEEGIARVWKDILQERVQQLMQRQVPTVQMAQKTGKKTTGSSHR